MKVQTSSISQKVMKKVYDAKVSSLETPYIHGMFKRYHQFFWKQFDRQFKDEGVMILSDLSMNDLNESKISSKSNQSNSFHIQKNIIQQLQKRQKSQQGTDSLASAFVKNSEKGFQSMPVSEIKQMKKKKQPSKVIQIQQLKANEVNQEQIYFNPKIQKQIQPQNQILPIIPRQIQPQIKKQAQREQISSKVIPDKPTLEIKDNKQNQEEVVEQDQQSYYTISSYPSQVGSLIKQQSKVEKQIENSKIKAQKVQQQSNYQHQNHQEGDSQKKGSQDIPQIGISHKKSDEIVEIKPKINQHQLQEQQLKELIVLQRQLQSKKEIQKQVITDHLQIMKQSNKEQRKDQLYQNHGQVAENSDQQMNIETKQELPQTAFEESMNIQPILNAEPISEKEVDLIENSKESSNKQQKLNQYNEAQILGSILQNQKPITYQEQQNIEKQSQLQIEPNQSQKTVEVNSGIYQEPQLAQKQEVQNIQDQIDQIIGISLNEINNLPICGTCQIIRNQNSRLMEQIRVLQAKQIEYAQKMKKKLGQYELHISTLQKQNKELQAKLESEEFYSIANPNKNKLKRKNSDTIIKPESTKINVTASHLAQTHHQLQNRGEQDSFIRSDHKIEGNADSDASVQEESEKNSSDKDAEN